MALKKSGITLIAEGYSQYRKTLQEINRLHKEAFSDSYIKNYNQAASQFSTQSSKMSKSAQSTWQMVENLRGSFDNAAASGSRFGGLGSKISNAFSSMGASFSNAAGGLSNMASGLGKFALKATGVLTIINTLMGALQFLEQAGDLAARVETLSVSLNEMGQNAGYSSEQISYAVESLKQQGITTQASHNALLRMARANISWSEASKLAAIAQSSAVVAGMNSSAAFERLITGIQKMEPELLDELGITLQRSKAYDAYAATLGKSAMALTQQEKQQAILNEIYRQSEGVMGVYDAAMETTGKKQGSLARHIEETQLQVGKMMLPLKSTSVELQTNFWKGLNKVTKGISVWGNVISTTGKLIKTLLLIPIKSFGALLTAIFPGLRTWWESLSEGQGVLDRIGEGIFNFGKLITLVFTSADALINTWFDNLSKNMRRVGSSIGKLFTGDIQGALQELSGGFEEFKGDFEKNFLTAWEEQVKLNPDLLKSWDEMKKAAEKVDLTPDLGPEEIDTETIKEKLEALADVYKRLDDIQRKFTADRSKLEKQQIKELEKIEKEYQKSLENAAKKRDKDLSKVNENAAKEEAKLRAEGNKKIAEDQKKLHRDMENELKRFQLSQMQALRRFAVQDRRLRAEGDILGLMQAREDYELEQKEAKENFELQQQEQKKSAEEQVKIQQDELQQRLAELKASTEERRNEIKAAYEEEVQSLQAANQEKLEEQLRSQQERYDALVESRNQEIEELGRSLNEEGKITQEGMQTIADEISKVFGENAAGDALIKGWTERTTTEFGSMVATIEQQLKDLESGLSNMSQPTTRPVDSFGFSAGRGGGRGGRRGPRRGMQHGGSGVVTGPAEFFVEPGVTEHYSFTPLNQVSHSGNISMGLDVSGMPAGLNEKLEQAIIERAADMTMQEIRIAIERLRKR